MNYKKFSMPRCHVDVPLEVMEALAHKSAEMGFGRAGYLAAAYLVEALSQLTVEELKEVLRRKDLLPEEERRCMICNVPVSQCCC
jgi:hypothetical protein